MKIKNKKKITTNVLSEEDVAYIKYLINEGYADAGLDKMWGVSRGEINHIRHNKRWWDVKPMEYADR